MQFSVIFPNINSSKIRVLADRDWNVNCTCLTSNMAATQLVKWIKEQRHVIRLLWPHDAETGEGRTELHFEEELLCEVQDGNLQSNADEFC